MLREKKSLLSKWFREAFDFFLIDVVEYICRDLCAGADISHIFFTSDSI